MNYIIVPISDRDQNEFAQKIITPFSTIIKYF